MLLAAEYNFSVGHIGGGAKAHNSLDGVLMDVLAGGRDEALGVWRRLVAMYIQCMDEFGGFIVFLLLLDCRTNNWTFILLIKAHDVQYRWSTSYVHVYACINGSCVYCKHGTTEFHNGDVFTPGLFVLSLSLSVCCWCVLHDQQV